MLKLDNVSAKRGRLLVLEDISFTLDQGKTLAVVGESGAGKSTLIAAILGLLRITAGSISWRGLSVDRCRPALVMQEPRAAFNPALSLMHSVMEPIVAQGAEVPSDRIARLCDALELSPRLLDRRPNEVSIGQAQRVGILRAMIAASPLILFDEPLSALDAVTQKHTARLIAKLQEEEGFAALIVTHDLDLAKQTQHILRLKGGRIIENQSAVA